MHRGGPAAGQSYCRSSHPAHQVAARMALAEGRSEHSIVRDVRAIPRTVALVAPLAMSTNFYHAVCSAKTSSAQGIGTEFLAHREKIEVTRHDSTFESLRCPWGERIALTCGLFRRVKRAPEIATRWRSRMDSNPRSLLFV